MSTENTSEGTPTLVQPSTDPEQTPVLVQGTETDGAGGPSIAPSEPIDRIDPIAPTYPIGGEPEILMMIDDDPEGGGGGGGGGGGTVIRTPPTVTLAISSAAQAESVVKPGVNATINVSGTLTVTPVSALSTHSSTVSVTIGGVTVGASLANGSWSARLSIPTGSLTANTDLTVSASSSTSYTYSGTTTSGSKAGSASGTVTVRVDRTGPNVTVNGAGNYNEVPCPLLGSPNSVTVSGSVGDVGGAAVDRVWVGTDVNALTSFVPPPNGQWSRSVPLPTSLGPKTVYVRATDTVGNWSEVYSVVYTVVDKTPPEVGVDAVARLVFDDAALPLTVRGTCFDMHTGIGAVQVALKTAAGVAVGAPVAATVAGAGPNQRGTWTAALTVPAAGAYRVHVSATDQAGVSCPAVTADVYADAIPEPVIDITSHADGEVIPGGDAGVDIVVKGVASATMTQLARVEVSVGGGAFVTAVNDSGDWTRWSAPVHLSADGEQDVVARATTTARNPQVNRKTDAVRLSVGVRYTARDHQDNTSLLAYFLDLLRFATRRVRITENGVARMLTKEELAQRFHQPFDRLAFDEEVSQARLCVEALRGYAADAGLSADPTAVAAYRETAYRALLVQLGTSYDELRTLRTGTAAERQALADRLGVGSDPTVLDALLIAPSAVTEQALETVFGLESTTRDPLAGAPLAQLFRARSAHLRTVWRREDHVPGAPVIVDPDLVPLEAIPASKRSASNLAYSLWTARRDWIAAQLAALSADRLSGEADQPRLARLVGKAAAPTTMAALLALDAERAAGRDVSEGIASHGLTPAGFDFLVRMHAAAGRGPLLAAEWDDVVSLLAQLAKLRRADTWRAEEAALVLGPDDFQPADMPRLPAWRGTAAQWRAWSDRLRARADQDDAMVRGYADAVAAAEAAALPVLRDALVAAAAPAALRTPQGLETVANWLTQRLMVDVQASGALRTTRLAQAVETLQGILGALRAGRFMEMDLQVGPLPPGDWTLTVKDVAAERVDATFDLEWAWMGSYATWQAAMRVFLYPENLLLPTLRDGASAEFLAALATRGPGPLSAEGADAVAEAYLAALAANATATSKLNAVVPAWGAGGWKTRTKALDAGLAETELPPRAAAIRQMMVANTDAAATRTWLEELFFWMPMQLALMLQQAGQHTAALDWFRTVYGYNLKAGQRKVYHGLVEEETFPCVYQTTDQWLRTELNPHEVAPQRAGALTRFTLLSIARCFVAFADEEFAGDGGEAAARARTLYLGALELLGSADMRLPDGRDPAVAFGFQPNPEAETLRAHAELSLLKLRTGRNIAGMQRAAAVGAGAAAQAGGALQPTPYRYSVLVERAKQLATLAQQMEAQYLAALEKRDAETYNLVKARHDLGLTTATVQLQDLRIDEAAGGVTLAALQQSRARVQKDTYRGWIDAGPIPAEKAMLQNYRDAARLRNTMAKLDAAATVAQALTTAGSGGFLGTGLGGGLAGVAMTTAIAVGRASTAIDLNNLEAQTQANSFTASYERRKQEWQLQAALADRDEAIGAQQVLSAQAHLRIAGQERTIAQMQANNAASTVEFLASKFTSAELYEWMSGVLGRVYSYFLQQAAAIARLAEGQLAFERQERPLQVIKADYWQAPADSAGAAQDGDGKARDRRGLTGSARLLQDIYQLDQYAFETNKRKLQLTRTVSLAQVAPFELEALRRTGQLVFATPMELFDRDFPGHYLRLVRRVRASVVALIPPAQGIRATLSASGLSRVTVADGGFQTLTVRRDPETVALTSPTNASGMFELDVQSELLMPFEGMGVDTTWTLELPRAANPFDFGTIADVMLTVEYTALQSADYRQQVIRTLDAGVGGERGISFRDQFPDQWYDLGNGAEGAAPTVEFTVPRALFPPNVEGLRVESLLLYFAPRDGAPVQAGVADLKFPAASGGGAPTLQSAGPAQAVEGVISTRRNRWSSVVGTGPVFGTWSLTLDAPTAALVRSGAVQDLLLVIGYAGQTPAWPS